MGGPSPAVAATRVAVRRALTGPTGPTGLTGPAGPTEHTEPDIGQASGGLVLVACSGGADSLALAAATAFEAPRAGRRAGAVIVDHGLQPGSAEVAREAASVCKRLGLAPVVVVRTGGAGRANSSSGTDETSDTGGSGGPEAAAREARYAALTEVARELGAGAVLLGHTRDDQAEQVLLGLARGSGARSLAGMPRARDIFVRPLLDLPAETTRQACSDLGLEPWADPHNSDERYLRVRARRLVQVLEAELGPGVAAALARSANLLRTDADALDALAARSADAIGAQPWPVTDLAVLDDAVRGRVWRLLARDAGVPLGGLSHRHVAEADRLLHDYRGQGGISWPGGYTVTRRGGRITIDPPVGRPDGSPVD